MENRYHNLLQTNNQQILAFCPANWTLREILALELKKALKENKKARVLELAVGEGDQTTYLLKHNPEIKLDVVDESWYMIEQAHKNLKGFSNQIGYYRVDAKSFLQSNGKQKPYDAIVSSWFIHNLSWKEKQELINLAREALNDDGTLLLFDKIYPNNVRESEKLFEIQNKRYSYLDKELEKAIIEHEYKDYDHHYIMTEKTTKQLLRTSGFYKIEIIDRLERDVVLLAKKQALFK